MFATLKRTARHFRAATPAALEAVYLDGASDRFDLEAREREIDSGLFRTRTLGF